MNEPFFKARNRENKKAWSSRERPSKSGGKINGAFSHPLGVGSVLSIFDLDATTWRIEKRLLTPGVDAPKPSMGFHSQKEARYELDIQMG